MNQCTAQEHKELEGRDHRKDDKVAGMVDTEWLDEHEGLCFPLRLSSAIGNQRSGGRC